MGINVDPALLSAIHAAVGRSRTVEPILVTEFDSETVVALRVTDPEEGARRAVAGCAFVKGRWKVRHLSTSAADASPGSQPSPEHQIWTWSGGWGNGQSHVLVGWVEDAVVSVRVTDSDGRVISSPAAGGVAVLTWGPDFKARGARVETLNAIGQRILGGPLLTERV